MKFTFLFLLLGLLDASATGFGQTITLPARKLPVKDIFRAVEKQTGFIIFSNKELVKELKPMTLSVKDMPLRDFLSLIFTGTNLDFEITGKTIFLKDKTGNQGSLIPPNKNMLAAAATAGEVTGLVKGPDLTPLQGATVSVKGTIRSVVTDANGKFSLLAGPGEVLIISFVGYETLQQPVNGRTYIEIILAKAVQQIDEVVVTALGITKRTKSLTYHVQELNGNEVTTVKDANFVNSLAGKVAGVTINASSAGIGGSVRVIMRGAKSLFGNNNALYVIDGVPLPNLFSGQPGGVFDGANATGDGIANFNPDDIASVSVLTGPAAAALYGSQAANGVVVITTKKGAVGKTSLEVSNSTHFLSPFVLPQFQNTYGSDAGSYYSWGDKLKTPSTYKPADFFQTGTDVTNSLSLSSGTDKNQTYVSASLLNAAGIIPNNKLDRFNFSIRNTTSYLENKLSLDLGLQYIWQKDQNMIAQGLYFNPIVPIYLFPRGDDITPYQVYERYDITRNFKTQFWPFGDLGFAMQNPYWEAYRDIFTNDKNRYILSTGLKYKATSWLNFAGRVKLDDNGITSERKYYASTLGIFAGPAGGYYNNHATTRQVYADLLATVSATTGNFGLNATVGSSLSDTRYDLAGYGGNLFKVPDLFNFSNLNTSMAGGMQDAYHDQTQATFADVQLSYNNSVFLDGTGRNDWSSALANTTARSIFYPSIGLSGILSDLFNLQSEAVSFIKLRASYSEVGNAPQRFISIATYPLIGGLPVTSSYIPATGLQPERTNSYEGGLNLKFLRNKINLDLTVYQSATYNQLFNPVLAPSTGYSSFYVNAGKVTNKGIEATLGYTDKIGKVAWSTNATFTLNRNRIDQLLNSYTDKTTGEIVQVDSLSLGGTGSYMMAIVKGGSIGDIYTTTLVTDEHGYIKVDPRTRQVMADPNTYVKAGNASPRYSLGWRNTISFRNFDLGFLISARLGGVGVSITQAIMDQFGVSLTSAQARDNGGALVNGFKVPAQTYYSVAGGGVAGVGSLYVYSATNVRLGEASLAYTLPSRLFHNKIKAITISAVGRNLFMFYNKAPFDPESTASTGTYYQGIDYFMQPSLRSVGFSAKIQL